MSQSDVFLCARSADYAAAWECYKNLTDGGLHCFFGDEALLKLGDEAYRKRVLHARAQTDWLVLFLSRPEDAAAPYLEETWQAFQDRPGQRLLLLPRDYSQALLPHLFQNSQIYGQDAPRDGLVKILIGLSRAPEAAGTSLRTADPENTAEPKTIRLRWRPLAAAAGLAVLLGSAGWHFSNQRPAGVHDLAHAGADPPPDAVISLWEADPLTGVHQIRIGQAVQEFSWIPPGRFYMGSPDSELNHRDDETLRLKEISQGFWMARTECTQELWQEVMGEYPSQLVIWDGPVESVSWEDIAGRGPSFLTRLNARGLLPDGLRFALPDEIQWEYACRAGSPGPFSFGEVMTGALANVDGRLPYAARDPGAFANGIVSTGSYLPNAWHLFDMHGNVQEWCASEIPNNLVLGPETERVLRGGSWRWSASQSRSAARLLARGDIGDDTTGFRLVVVAKR